VRCLENIDVVILAGGQGTRLRSAVPNLPKILAPVRGRPILDWQLNWLETFGPKKVTLSLGHLSKMVETYLEENRSWDFEIVTLTESKPLGTGGALLYCASSCQQEYLLVLNGDTLLEADLCQFLEARSFAGTASSILCAKISDPSRYGEVTIENDIVINFSEKKPVSGTTSFVNAGCYIFNRNLLSKFSVYDAPSLEEDILPALIKEGMAAYTKGVKFLDIGTPDGISLANNPTTKIGDR